MDFNLSEEESLVLESAKRLALTLRASAPSRDQRARLDGDAGRALAELGLYGLMVPAEDGGSGLSPLIAALVVDALARQDPALAYALAAHLFGAVAAVRAAGGRWPALAEVEAPVAFAWFEGDRLVPTRLETTAVLDPAGYRLTGAKPWVALGAQPGPCLVLARRDAGLGAFWVAADAPGVVRAPVTGGLGLRGAAFAHLRFEGAPGTPIGGELSAAVPGLLESWRLGVAAVALGLGRASLEEARAYALERRQFRQPISDFQAIQWMLADLATDNDGARLLALAAADRLGRGQAPSGLAARAKVRAVEASIDAAMKAIQIFGGNGYVREYPVEQQLRDANTLAGLSPSLVPDRSDVAAGLYAV